MKSFDSNQLEKIWLKTKKKKDLNKLLLALKQADRRAFVVDDVVFVKIELPSKIRKVFEICYDVITDRRMGKWEQMVSGVSMCRLINPNSLKKEKISNEIFKQLDSLVATLFPSVASPDLVRFSLDEYHWNDFCFTTNKIGNPFNEVFLFNKNTYYLIIKDYCNESETTKIIEEIEHNIPTWQNISQDALEFLYSENFFGRDEKLFVHYLNDNMDDHGFLRMPWAVSVGLNYAFIEVRQGSWY